jgi:hypothetical protein
MSFKNPADNWTLSGPNILAPENLATLRERLEKGPVIVEHWFYYAGRSPDRLVFDDYEDLEEYLKHRSAPGDSLWVWDYSSLCRDENYLVRGKRPDEEGRVPEKGAY